MFLQPHTIISHVGRSLTIILSLWIGLTASSCKCKNTKQPGSSAYEDLNMQVSPTSLIGQKRDIVATFKLNGKSKTADLTQFKLKISWVETGGNGSKVSYLNRTGLAKVIAKELEEPITYFTNKTELKAGETALQIPFTLDPGPTVNSLDIKFELVDPTGKAQEPYTATWKKIGTPVHLKAHYDPLSQSITYNIQNTSQAVLKNLQLRYTNSSRDPMALTILLNGKKENTITWGDLAGDSSTGDCTLNLNSSPGVNTAFIFEVLYEGTPIATHQVDITTKPVNLHLVAEGPSFLIESKKQVGYLVQAALDSGPVDANQLRLSIQTTEGATILYKGLPVKELLGNQLDKSGSGYRMVLHIQPGINRIVTSTVQLKYAGNPMGNAQTFIWQDDLNQVDKELFEAVLDSHVEKFKEALRKGGIQINSANAAGETPLHLAAEKGNPEIIKLLLDAGANLHAKKNHLSRQSPFYSAVDHRNQEAIKVFLAQGIDINAMDEDGDWNPLANYVIGGKIEAAKLLLAHGANSNVRNPAGNTALQGAVLRSDNREELITLLLDQGADINTKNNYGHTPLHNAYLGGAEETPAAIKLLIDLGAAINEVDNYGNTLLHYLVQGEREDFAQILLDNGARKDIKNNEGETALDLAKLSNKPAIKNLFGIPHV